MNPLIINFSLAAFWLLFGIVILAAEWLYGPQAYRPLNISMGWWVLLLSLYNWVRVSMIWSGQREHRARLEAEDRESSLARREPRGPEQPPDPNFIFTDQPPGPKKDEGGQGDKVTRQG